MTDPRTTTVEADPEIEAPADDTYMDDGVFDADAFHAETKGDPYPFRWAGEVWEMTNVYDLDDSVLDLIGADEVDTDDIKKVVEAAFGKEQWAALTAKRRLPIRVEVELFNRWMRTCGVNLGEAGNSADSSASTAERSKRTSRGTMASGSTGRSTARKKAATRRGNSSR